ncbi:hypothetical protein BCR35DRAFT_352713 [Leucosporidium creatinivorum]|uniref:BTB domain-containing protein n=1 Tax=Leucosporidium creatinivorum TaxID=106004 RepID=A0A1Y2F5V3_9BASI|nr:hypothetical protein BCR35DRAFT_352713 [Leucosporidium creatinivorum]
MPEQPESVHTTLIFETTLDTARECAVHLPPSMGSAARWTLVLKRDSYSASYGLRWDSESNLSQLTKASISLYHTSTSMINLAASYDLLPVVRGQPSGEKSYAVGPSDLGLGSRSRYTSNHLLFVKLELCLKSEDREETSSAERLARTFAPTLLSTHPSDVRLYFPLSDLELWANSASLTKVSPYFQALLTSDFLEAEKRSLESKTESEGQHWKNTSEFKDSDDELDSALKLKSKIRKGKIPARGFHSDLQFHEVIVTDIAFATYQACLVWIATGHISFAPLSSTRPPGQSRVIGPAVDLDRPQKVSPKSIYRLAEFLSLPELQTLALDSIASQLTVDSVAYELFSDVTAAYDEICDVVVASCAANWSAVQASDSMKLLKAEARDGGLELSGAVFLKLMELVK